MLFAEQANLAFADRTLFDGGLALTELADGGHADLQSQKIMRFSFRFGDMLIGNP